MMAGIHANEWIGPASTMYMMDMMMKGFKEGNKQERDILHNMDWYAVPVSK